MTVAAILHYKGQDVTAVLPDTMISDVANVLTQKRIGAVLVCDATGKIVGMLSERDIVRGIAHHGAATLDFAAAQLMSSPVHAVVPETPVETALAIMTDKRVRHLPVLDRKGVLIGLVSIGDVVKATIDQQAVEVDSLKAYVTGHA